MECQGEVGSLKQGCFTQMVEPSPDKMVNRMRTRTMQKELNPEDESASETG